MSAKVLVADDSGVMRKIIIRALNACGVTDVVEAGDGAEALVKFNEHPIDLVPSDWNMPGKTGLEFLRCVRAINATVPFLLITTEAEKTRVMEAIQAGVSDYIVKPFDNEILKEKLDKYVDAVAVS